MSISDLEPSQEGELVRWPTQNFRAANPKAHLPPDVIQKMDTANKAGDSTERFAQQTEKIVNGELTASEKK